MRRPAAHRGRATLALVASVSLLLTSCGQDGGTAGGDSDTTAAERTVEPVHGTELPIDARPAFIGQGQLQPACPYLDTEWVQNTNGQRITGIGVDTRFDPPACVFWSYEDTPAVQVMVRKMTTNSDAVAVVDHAAPIDETLKALEPEGWSGGLKGSKDGGGSLYAVWKDEDAVVTFSEQPDSAKPRDITAEAIKNLGL